MLLSFLKNTATLIQPQVSRVQNCAFCGANTGHLIAKVDYWNLSTSNLIQCSKCNLAQLDPMLSDEMMDVGCTAFYRLQHRGEDPKSIQRGFLRAFRKGVSFGTRLKLAKINPKRLLEVGAGDGYFSRGIQFVFPELNVTCMDLVDDVLEHIQKHHGFEALKGSPESIDISKAGKFDFIIARDVIEHLASPRKAIETLNALLIPGGYLHFIVPNGNEDYWALFCNWRLKNQSSEMLLNHVNYFDPPGLHQLLVSSNLIPRFWFTYDFKGTRQGFGRTLSDKFTSQKSQARSAQKTIDESPPLETSFKDVSSEKVLKAWWIKMPKFIGMIYCFFKHYPLIKLNANSGIGHEIFCLAKKTLPRSGSV